LITSLNEILPGNQAAKTDEMDRSGFEPEASTMPR
jgi:hypothetical protein